MRRQHFLAILLAAVIGASPGLALSQENEPQLVEELVVRAGSGGPAWWKVSRGNSTVWILGTPPYGASWLNWNASALNERLDGAKSFIAPIVVWPVPGPQGSASAALNDHDRIGRKGLRLGDQPEDLRQGIAAAVKSLTGQTAEMNWGLVFTTRLITSRLFVAAGLQQRSLRLELVQAANALRVPVRTLTIDTRKEATDWMQEAKEDQLRCLANVIGDAYGGVQPIRNALLAWSVGDIPNALATAGCTGAKIPVYPKVVAATVSAIDGDLRRPGVSVAAVELMPLLMENGVIQRLQAAGYKVEPPDTIDLL